MKKILIRATLLMIAGNTLQLMSSDADTNTLELRFAIETNNLAKVKLLIPIVNVKTQSSFDRSFLHMCTDPDILRELLNAGADVNSRQSGGDDPFDRDGGSRTEPWPLFTPLQMMKARLEYKASFAPSWATEESKPALKACIEILERHPDLIRQSPEPATKPKPKCCSIQ